jgi:neutral ceramidase
MTENHFPSTDWRRRRLPAWLLCLVGFLCPWGSVDAAEPDSASRQFQAGAATANITPPLSLDSPIAGDWERPAGTYIHDELLVRCVVLDDGETRIGIAVVDNIGIPRYVLDQAKQTTHQRTGLEPQRILISCTHTHSAASARGRDSMALDQPLDGYQRLLIDRIADAFQQAITHLEAAEIGFGSAPLPDEVFHRRWLMKPGTSLPNPFGGTDQVRMNPGVGNPDLLEPAGPTDPEIAFLAVRSIEGRPIALLANYSLHYVGGVPRGHISADYFGYFAEEVARLLDARQTTPPFVAMMSNGTSGNINNINYRGGQIQFPPYGRMQMVAHRAAAAVYGAVLQVEYQPWVPIGMAERDLNLATRQPDPELLQRAREIVANPQDYPRAGRPSPQAVVSYAEATVRMHQYPPEIAIPLQALRIGDLAITAIPFEVFVQTGLELKEKSPFPRTFTISIANGTYGYLPTVRDHELGGYETWLGTSRMEVEAAPKIVSALLEMLGELK